MSKEKTEVKEILGKYGNDAGAIQERIYELLKEQGIPYIKPLDTGLFELYDGKRTKIVDQTVVDKLQKESIQQSLNKANENTAGKTAPERTKEEGNGPSEASQES